MQAMPPELPGKLLVCLAAGQDTCSALDGCESAGWDICSTASGLKHHRRAAILNTRTFISLQRFPLTDISATTPFHCTASLANQVRAQLHASPATISTIPIHR